MIRRSYFTLVEMMIALAIIALIAGVVLFNVRGASLQQRFQTETATVLKTLQFAQKLMLATDGDVIARFEESPGGGIQLVLETDLPLTEAWAREIERPKRFREIHRVEFIKDIPEAQSEGTLELHFLSGGQVMSRGVLLMSSQEERNHTGELVRTICLPGYPHHLSVHTGDSEELDCPSDPDEELSQMLLRQFREETS